MYFKNFYTHLMDQLNEYFETNGISAYREAGNWTKIITKNQNGLSLIDLALMKTFPNAKLANEYYHIDNCIYENINEGCKKINNMNYHQWRLIAAVEHENAWNDWSDELVKLTYIQCPLRVIISYGNIDYDEGNYVEALHHANQVAQVIHLENYIHENQEFALIFGPRLADLKNNSKIVDLYKAYIWNGNEFEKYMK